MNRLTDITGIPTAVEVVQRNLVKVDPYLLGRMDIIEVYGAVGDGTTDDTAAFVAAIAALDRLELPSGYTFLISAITISKAKFVLCGKGGMAVVKAKASTNANLITFDGTGSGGGYFRVSDIEVNGNKANQTTGSGIVLKNASYSWAEKIYVHDCKSNGIEIVNYNASVDADEINIVDWRSFSNGGHGLYIHATGSPTQGPGDHLIIGGHSNYNGGCGIKAEALIATLISENNLLTNTSHGLHIDWGLRNIVNANSCRNNGGNGIRLDSTLGNWSHDNIISGNQCHYNSSAGAGISSNMDIWDQTRPVITGNYCGDSDFTSRASYGLQLYQCVDARLSGNNFDPTHHTTGGVFVNQTGTGVTYNAKGNIGLADYTRATETTDNGTLTDIETNVVRYSNRIEPAKSSGVNYSTGLYMRVKPRTDADDGPAQVNGITMDITDQADTYGGGMVIHHSGAGDAIYVGSLLAGGAALEAASFANGTKGIISTLQVSDCFYSVLFNALWDQTTVPGYGMYYADLAPGAAFTARVKAGSTASTLLFRAVNESLVDLGGIRNDGSYSFPNATYCSGMGTSGTSTLAARSDHTHTYSDVGAAAASHSHSASDTTSGTFDAARIPDLSGTYSLTGHNHSGVYEPAIGAKSANYFFGGPTSGDPAVPTWRALTATDMPVHSHSYEPPLGNPTTSGDVLASTTGGTRSWAAVATAGTANTIAKRDSDGGLTAAFIEGVSGTHFALSIPTGADCYISWGGTAYHRFYSNGDVTHAGTVSAAYKSSDGTAGATGSVAVRNSDNTGVVILNFKNGLFVGAS